MTKYFTQNEWNHFRYDDASLMELHQINGYFYMIMDNVTILEENSCNRDIRDMRTNDLRFTIPDGHITKFIQEGYKLYDPYGNLIKEVNDVPLEQGEYENILRNFEGGFLNSIEKTENSYLISFDTEDASYSIEVAGITDKEEWNRFLNFNAI